MKRLIKFLKSYFCKTPTCLCDAENEQHKKQSSGNILYPRNNKRPNLFIGSDVSMLFKKDEITTVGEFAKINSYTMSNDEKITLWKEQNPYRAQYHGLSQCPFDTNPSLEEQILELL